ncbi:hypothetical protein OG345_39925 [Streptomyces sp. NBC_01220]|uniref:hypothetical protein n=1 Tax=Streptomyces sp. NBC_01220 TaxID=2903781 RepID=UPI00352E194D|nr:hypothetical protein OG345_39925 [Streptomyces sp. NBC_01220]
MNDTYDDQPVRDLSAWAVDRLEEALATARDGHELESIRVIAQSRAYGCGNPDSARLRWAKLSLTANERLPGGTPWNDAQKRCQDFALRAWIIKHVCPGTDPDWDPEALAADTLAALTLAPGRARSLSTGWHDFPAELIGELRRRKNMTAMRTSWCTSSRQDRRWTGSAHGSAYASTCRSAPGNQHALL